MVFVLLVVISVVVVVSMLVWNLVICVMMLFIDFVMMNVVLLIMMSVVLGVVWICLIRLGFIVNWVWFRCVRMIMGFILEILFVFWGLWIDGLFWVVEGDCWLDGFVC